MLSTHAHKSLGKLEQKGLINNELMKTVLYFSKTIDNETVEFYKNV